MVYLSITNGAVLLLLLLILYDGIVSALFRSELIPDWLDRLRITIPDQSFSAQFLTIQLRNLSCTHFSIAHIDSIYESSTPQESPQFHLIVHEVAASCSGIYQASGGIHGTLSAQLSVENSESNGANAALEWTLAVLDDPTVASVRTPGAIQSLQCVTHLAASELHFSGSSASAHLLELFRDVILRAVNREVRDQICPVLQPRVDAMGTAYLQAARRWYRPYLEPGINDTTTMAMQSDLRKRRRKRRLWSVDYEPEERQRGDDFHSELPALVDALHSLNDFIDMHLNHGFLPHNITVLNESSSCGGFSNGINGLLRQYMPDILTIPIDSWSPPPIHVPHSDVAVKLYNISLSGAGLSEWISLQLLRPDYDRVNGSQAFEFHSQLETPANVSVAVALNVRVPKVLGPDVSYGDFAESLVLHVDVRRILGAVDVAIHFRRDILECINVGMIAKYEDLKCLIGAIQSMEVGNLVGALGLSRIYVAPVPNGVNPLPLEYDMDHLMNSVLDLMVSEYPETITTVISGVIRDPWLQDHINRFIAQQIIPVNATFQCNNTPMLPVHNVPNPTPHWINFTDFVFLHRLNTYLNQSGTLGQLNQYMDCTTNALKNAFRQKFVQPNDGSSLKNRSTMQLVDFDVVGAGNVQQLELFLPTTSDGLHLESSWIWGSIDSLEVRPHLSFSINVFYLPLNVSAIFNLTIVIDDFQLVGGMVLPFDLGQFRQMSLLELLSHAQCALVPVEKARFEIYESENRLRYFDILLNASLTLLEQNSTLDFAFSSNDFPEVRNFSVSLMEWSISTGIDLTRAAAKYFLALSSEQCNGNSSDQRSAWTDPDSTLMKPLFLILFSLFLFLQPAVLLINRSRDASDDDNARLDVTSNTGRQCDNATVPLLHPRYRGDEVTDNEDHIAIHRTVEPFCFMLDKSIPEFFRHVIPISIMVTVFLLFVSNISVGATVDIRISPDADDGNPLFPLPSLFAFGLINTARDMLKAGIYPLFFLVVVFSGIWPYMKLFLMLFAWMGPKSILGDSLRGELLFKLDAFSKFSLVDTYVLIVMLVAFRFHLPLVNETSLDVYVSPHFGFFGFLLATTSSLVIGHIVLFFHRYAEIPTNSVSAVVDEQSPILLQSPKPSSALGFRSFPMADGSERKFSRTAQFLFLSLFVLVLVMLCVGLTQKCFVFEIGGLAGLILGNDKNRVEYSVVSFAQAIPSSAEHPSWITIRWLQIAFYFYTIVMPFVALALLSILWVVPLKWSVQFILLTLAEVANAWSAVEVFCLSIVAALLEIETFTNFIIGHRCDWMNQLLLQYSETIGVDTCYSVTSSVSWNGVFLVAGALFNSFLVSTSLRFFQSSIHEHILSDSGESQAAVLPMDASSRSFWQHPAFSRWGSWLFCECEDPDDSISVTMDIASNLVTPFVANDEISEDRDVFDE